MEYRKIGKTDMQAGVIGIGTEYLDNKPYEIVEEVIHAALENNINMMDLFMPGETVRKNIGLAMGSRRKDFIIQGHIGSTDIGQQYDICRDLDTCKRYFENLLTCLKTDYIDIGMLFYIDTEEDFNKIFDNGIVDYAKTLKKQGVVRALGASAHNPKTAKMIVETELLDLLMFSVNPAFDMMPEDLKVDTMLEDDYLKGAGGVEPARAELYALCEKMQVSITTMKTLGAGKLLSKEYTPFEQPLTIQQCIHYALQRPAVISTLIGYKSKSEVEEAIRYLTLPQSEKEYSHIIGGKRNNFKGSCVYCSHCQPCPAEIDIASVNKYLDIALLDESNIPPGTRSHYNTLAHHGSECIACGSCEERCPFDVPIIENMERAKQVFGV
ncbi:MAG: aldo/keto reductase [Christensenellaceae bacterium]|jgi:predicted aldo/keto reductase-like oxidoreductase